MGKKEEYIRRKDRILTDKKICEANRKLFKKFFEETEYKLKRKNRLSELDNGCYKTLCGYTSYFKNVNLWFKNKEWKKLTKTEIKKVYDDLEDLKLRGCSGKIITSRTDYYDKIFKSLPFELAGKVEIAREVMKYYENNHKNEDVRFFEEESFKKIAGATETTIQRLLCWLAWDIGENIFSLIQLQKLNCVRNVNQKTKDVEYIINLPREKIKRSRRARSEITNFRETAQLLDVVLKDLEPEDKIFNFGHRNALKFLDKAVKKVNVVCIPKGQKVTFKDFRSSMACHLIKIGWTTDEIKARLGHSPSSKAIDKYCNYLSMGKGKPKVKVQESQIESLIEEVEKLKQMEKLTAIREETKNEEIEDLQKRQKQMELIVKRIVDDTGQLVFSIEK
ncbi:MAG: hypothetical protein KJ566_00835 [Nanoarchaeota archaeon]|nr:hypothetical protein [Nanoarchaeota archaeon]